MEISAQEVYRLVFKEYPDVLTVKQVSEMLGLCEKTIYKLIANGSLPVLKVGRQFRIAKVNVIRYMKMLRTHTEENSFPTS